MLIPSSQQRTTADETATGAAAMKSLWSDTQLQSLLCQVSCEELSLCVPQGLSYFPFINNATRHLTSAP